MDGKGETMSRHCSVHDCKSNNNIFGVSLHKVSHDLNDNPRGRLKPGAEPHKDVNAMTVSKGNISLLKHGFLYWFIPCQPRLTRVNSASYRMS